MFLESETAVAVLTSGPGLRDGRNLFNDEIAATKTLFEAVGGHGRILNRTIVHADVAEEVDMMSEWRDALTLSDGRCTRPAAGAGRMGEGLDAR